MKPRTSLWLLVMLSLVLLMGSITTTDTIAQSDEQEGSSSPGLGVGDMSGNQVNGVEGGPGFVTVSAYKFVTVNLNDPMGRSGFFLYNPRDTTINYAAQVDLPNGAYIKKMVTYYYDVTSVQNLRVRLKRVNLTNGADLELGSTLSWGNIGFDWETVDITLNNLVDLQNYYYFLDLTIPGGYLNTLGLVSVRVDYEYPGYIPCVNK